MVLGPSATESTARRSPGSSVSPLPLMVLTDREKLRMPQRNHASSASERRCRAADSSALAGTPCRSVTAGVVARPVEVHEMKSLGLQAYACAAIRGAAGPSFATRGFCQTVARLRRRKHS